MGFSVGRKRLQSAYILESFDLEEISDATVCVSGSSMRVREVVTAVTRGVMQVRLSEAERRWPVGERLRDRAEKPEALPKPPTLAAHRLSRWPFPSRGSRGSRISRTSLNVRLSR
jgi:hypothetical protein